jgi:hypothetical protein
MERKLEALTKSQECIRPEEGELLAAYEFGLLGEREAAVFEDHLARCPHCLEAVFEMSPVSRALTAAPERIAPHPAPLGASADEERGTAPPAGVAGMPPRGWRSRLQNWSRACRRPVVWAPAGALAAAALIIVMMTSGSELPYEEVVRLEPVPYTQLQTRGGNGSAAAGQFQAGMSAYATGRYREAADQLAAALQTAGENLPADSDQIRFYLGLSLLLDRRPAEARPHLAAASSSAVQPLSERAIWYSAQAELLLGRPERAMGYLQSLADSSIGYRARAESQLADLRKAAGE